MAINILIGIGGTGAKIVESALYLLAAGVGPKDMVHVCLIDQDNANGNVQRTEALLKLICHIQDELTNGQNKLDFKNANEAERTALFSIPLRPLLDDGQRAHWRPAPEDLPDLRAILQRSAATPAQQGLIDLLFRPVGVDEHESEQDLNLAEGYRGRAHVGSAALLSALHHDSPEFLKVMTERMRNGSAEGDEGVRIMLVGSLFGGTGAAGFPTIARSLHNMRSNANEKSAGKKINGKNISLGGVLMLPYFTFNDPEHQANVITTPQLLPQARVALDYYDRLLEEENVFDHLYISGWDQMIPLNYHEPGRMAQRNPAMLPELLAALAVQEFFTAPKVEPKPRPMMAARRENTAFGWTDLPIDPDKRQPVIDRIAQALRFAYIWRFSIDPDLKRGPTTGMFKRTPEFKSEIIHTHVKTTAWDAKAQALTQDVQEFCKGMLNWAANLRLYSRIDNLNLWNMGPVVAQTDLTRPQEAVTLHDTRGDGTRDADLETLVSPTSAQKPANGAAVYTALTAATKHGESNGLGRLIAAAYRAARLHHTAETSNVQ